LERLENRVVLSGSPPTTSGIYDVYVDEDAADDVTDLHLAFDDAEDYDHELTYEVTGNSNPGLFDAVDSGLGNGELRLEFAANANGSSQITVKATDTDFQYVTTSFTVYVSSVNDVPFVESNIDDRYLYEDDPDAFVNLDATFEDIEDPDGYLIYSVVENTNSSLFDSTDLGTSDGYAGVYLNLAPDQTGAADLTVRATDYDGAWVEESFTVYVYEVNDSPYVETGISDVNVDEDAADQFVNLDAAFADVDHTDEELTYTVVGNTNSDLFDSISDGFSAGDAGFFLDFAQDAYGEAHITVRATDDWYGWVETSFTVYIAAVNDAPVISGFSAIEQSGWSWLLSGIVTDVDDDVAGLDIDFGGVLAGFSNAFATVNADGSFTLSDEFVGIESGQVTAQTEDPYGLVSNEAKRTIVVS